jgi:hypothetical protein
MSKKLDLVGQSFEKLLVVSQADSRGGKTYWNCICECGREKVVRGKELKSGDTKSCGCLVKENSTTHGMHQTSTYKIWRSMKNRCLNPKNKGYQHYGSRGISVCDRWLKFENFYIDMGEKPEGMSLDRKNNDGPYSPENCRWATPREQSNNQRSNHLITYQDKTQTLSQWAEELGISRNTLLNRLTSRWTVEKALTTPPRPMKKAS